MKYIYKNKKQNGYAMLFTVIIVSAISIITAGLINAIYKQLILSSLAKDSQSAFYQADTASECALYMDRVLGQDFIDSNPFWSCGKLNLDVKMIDKNFSLIPADPDSLSPCFRVDVTKEQVDSNKIKTTIKAKGYNICNLNNPRTVERAIEINYTE